MLSVKSFSTKIPLSVKFKALKISLSVKFGNVCLREIMGKNKYSNEKLCGIGKYS